MMQGGLILGVNHKNSGFSLPGGRLEDGESFEAAARRELFEEAGVSAGKLIEVYDRVNDGWHCKVFIPVTVYGEPKEVEEGTEVRWISPHLLKIGRFPEYNTKMLESLGVPAWDPNDSHAKLASDLSGKPLNKVTREERQAAKIAAFGSLYGADTSQFSHQKHRDALAAMLVEKSLRTGDFTLASGRKSTWLIDCKTTVLTSEGSWVVGEVLHNAVQVFFPNATVMAGVELGGCPLASAVVQTHARKALVDSITQPPNRRGMVAAYVRKARKDHGSGNLVECGKTETKNTVLLEDVITTGGSSLRAVESLRKEGFNVLGIIALVDRDEGGKQTIEAAGIKCMSVFTAHDLLVAPVMKS